MPFFGVWSPSEPFYGVDVGIAEAGVHVSPPTLKIGEISNGEPEFLCDVSEGHAGVNSGLS